MARTKWGGRIIERKAITKDTEVELLVFPPLSAPKEAEPTATANALTCPAISHVGLPLDRALLLEGNRPPAPARG
jgi:hypothetical protein